MVSNCLVRPSVAQISAFPGKSCSARAKDRSRVKDRRIKGDSFDLLELSRLEPPESIARHPLQCLWNQSEALPAI